MNDNLMIALGILDYDDSEVDQEGDYCWENVEISENKLGIPEGTYEHVTFVPSSLSVWVDGVLYDVDLVKG